jgi:RND family efflux transporter, MFP subunit
MTARTRRGVPAPITRTSRSFMRFSFVVHGAALGLAALLASACSTKQDQRGRPPVPVSVAKVRTADVPYTIEANGVVIPSQSSAVTSQVEGIVQRVAFREGQDVVKGQVLFEIDSRPYLAAYRQASANLARDRANAENAQREAARYASLVQQDYVTREQADQQRANAAATAASAAATEAAVAAAKFNLDNTTIRAPISGRTGALLVREGNVVHASGSAPLVVINQISPLLVRFAIPATQLPLLQRYGSAGGLTVIATQSSGATTVDTSSGAGIGLSGGSDPGGPPAASGPPTGVAPVATSALSAITQPEYGSLTFIDNAVDTTTGTSCSRPPSRIRTSGSGSASSCRRGSICSSSRTRSSYPRRRWSPASRAPTSTWSPTAARHSSGPSPSSATPARWR